MPYQDALRHEFSNLDPLAALRAPADALLGVDAAAKAALGSLGLETVFDLASSPLFRLASDIAAAVQGRDSNGLSRFDRVPGGVAAPDSPVSLVDFANADIASIRSLSPAQATQLKTALDIERVADLGRWPPYVAARAVLGVAGGLVETERDAASELVPRMGEFPTERHYYSTIVMDRVAVRQTSDLVTTGPIDILPALAANFGFDAPAVGARLTFEQSWFAHGVTLGNLLHSVALAPGESTRVAVVDWSRQTSATGSETIGETEALTATTSHNRAVSEIQDAVATEVQSGFSHTESTATTKSGGGGFGFSMGPVSIGASGGIGKTTTSADSFSTSAGSRNLSASMSQQVADATHQAASSVRNRRATIVKEISETEHESVSTRILANYNHMHALTVQYFEVIEVYRVATGLHEAERCLFVPMKLIDFDERVITRFQGALAAAALNRRVFELLTTDFGMIRLSATRPMRPLITTLGITTAVLTRAERVATLARAAGETPAEPEEPTTPAPEGAPARPRAAAPAVRVEATWIAEEIRRASRITSSPLIRPGAESVLLPRDAQLEGISIALEGAGPPIASVTIRRQSGLPAVELTRTSIGWRVPGTVPLDELLEIVVGTGTGEGRAAGSLTLEFSYREAFFPLTMPMSAAANASTAVARVGETEAVPELVEHLQANRLHYNQAIWRSLDASTVALLLSKFTFEGITVADLIDPRPIQVAGNYLVFRMPGFVARASLPVVRDEGNTPEAAFRRSWHQFLKDRGLTFGSNSRQESLVPVPTGGVFAEAVLGRSNSAEKLDMTRFWNWQDSPIPLQPPEIAAINLGSRAQPIDVTPGRLSQPVLNIVNPTSLPDPTGLGPMLGALQSGNMFRDMSGLAATIGLAQGVAGEATSAANESQKLAAANLAVAAQKEVELARIAAQAVAGTAGSPAATAGTPKNASEMGALINSATARDAAKKSGAGSTGASSDSPQTGGGFGGSSGSSGGGGVIPSNTTFAGDSSSLGDAAFRRAMFGGLGAPAADVIAAVTSGAGATGVTNPSGVAQPVTLPNVGIGEIYFFANVKRIGNLRTFNQEIEAIENGQWLPASVDFRAISLRSGQFAPLRADAEVSSLDEFFVMLTRPAMRFNFFSYMQAPDTGENIAMNLQVQSGSTGQTGDTRNGFDLSRLDILSIQRLATLVSAGSTDPLAVAVRGIRTVNTATRASVRDESGNGVQRELRLYLCSLGQSFGPTDPFTLAQELATLLEMKVFALGDAVVFRPHLQTDPLDEIRGQVSLSDTGTVFQDVHRLDPDMQEFS